MSVHVHLSDDFEVNYNHLLTWFLPQLKTKENNALSAPDPGIGRVTNNVETITKDTKLLLTTSSYNVVIVLDMSASMFTVDMDHKKVIIEELAEALQICIAPLCQPDIHPWSDHPDMPLDVNITVLAYTPQFKTRFLYVLIQGYPLSPQNSPKLLETLAKRCDEMHDFIKSRSDKRSWCNSESNNNNTTRHGLFSLIVEVLNILQSQRSSLHYGSKREAMYANSKDVMIMITDGVIGETHRSRDIVSRLHSRKTSCSFVRVGACDPSQYGFGYIPNISLLRFISSVSGGLYWEYGNRERIRVEQVLQWSPFCAPPDQRGLIQKTVDTSQLTQTSLISTMTKKIYEGFKISDIDIKSQGQLARDFSGREITTLHVSMSLMWRKRIHVTFELVTDLPLDRYSVQKKVRVTLSIFADYEIITDRHANVLPLTPVKLLHQFNQFVTDQIRPFQEEGNGSERRWLFDLHNYAVSSVNKLKIDQAHKSEPYKIERLASAPALSDQDTNRFNKFWLHLLNERDFIDANFDVYRLKCWLQFDLTLPKCLTGVTRYKNSSNKEYQIYSRAHGFLVDVLMKWSNLVIEKEAFIKLYQIQEGSDSLNPKNSFVWAQIVWAQYTCASMSVYIACHRDIPFAEQHQIRESLICQLLSVKFQGSQLLDSSIKVGLDTTLKKRGGSFLPLKLKAEYACQQIPKNIDEIILWNNRKGELYLHKLVCNWKTCPDVNCCSDDLIKDLRNEIFNSLFRLRLQEGFRPVHVTGKVFSCFTMLPMKAKMVTSQMTSEESIPCQDEEEDGREIMCLLQYVITVDDEALPKDQRKISSDFTTEILIEPQWGTTDCGDGSLSYLNNLNFIHVPPRIFDLDFKLISSLCTFATIKKLCLMPDKNQPEFSDQFCPKPTTFKEPVSTPDLPYLFLVSNLLSKSLLNIINLPLLKVPDDGEEKPSSPNTQLLLTLSELLDSANKRNITLSSDEVKLIQTNVCSRDSVGKNITFSDQIPGADWKCYVRFHKCEDKEDETRLQFTLFPVPPEHFTEDQIATWFPDGHVNILVFDCFYKLLLGAFTNAKRCSLEQLYNCDRYITRTEDLYELECPALISQILEENTVSHSGVNLASAMKFHYVSDIGRSYEKSYILGVHYALQHDVALAQSCVERALELIEMTSLGDTGHIKKETKRIPLSLYLGAVCSHVSRQRTCCFVDKEMDCSVESSDRDATSESYAADIELTQELTQESHDTQDVQGEEGEERMLEDSASMFTARDTQGELSSDEGSFLSTPLQNDDQWTQAQVLQSLPLSGVNMDIYSGEIVSASSVELTPILSERKFEDSISGYNDRNADIDNDSAGSSSGNSLPRNFSSLTDLDALRVVSQPPSHWTVKEEDEEDEEEKEVDPASYQEEKKVSFVENLEPDCPSINIISSTPVMESGVPVEEEEEEEEDRTAFIFTEPHDSIKAKFDEIIDSRFKRISQYSDQFLILRCDGPSSEDDRTVAFFLTMSCSHSKPGAPVKAIKTLPTCVLDIVDEGEKKKWDMELLFTCYTLPGVAPSSPLHRSPTHSFRVPHRRRDSFKKADNKKTPGPATSGALTSASAHQFRGNLEDTDDGSPAVYLSPKFYSRPTMRSREGGSLQGGSASSPGLRVGFLPDPRRNIIDDLYVDIQWLIEDQHISHLRRKTPVSLDVLKQVLEHCKSAPPTATNCTVRSEDLSYVDSWKDDKQVRSEVEKVRHEELLANIVLAPEFESFRLCRINNFFYYALTQENEQKETGGREALSATSSISSIGSRPSQYRSSSSSAPDEIPVHSGECSLKPCSHYWIVINVQQTYFQVAFHATGNIHREAKIDEQVLDKIISGICHLNKAQNQRFLLYQIMDTKICPKELLFNPGPPAHGDEHSHNKYVCDVVHRIEVQLWDKTEREGLKDIRESLFNFKCDNSDQFVYFYDQQTVNADVRSTFYFQLPEPTNNVSKTLQIEVRGLQQPDPAKQILMDIFLQQKLEESKLEDIAHRLNRNNQAKLTEEEVTFLSASKNNKSYRTVYSRIPPYVVKFLPYFWFYLDQHLVQQELFSPRYYESNEARITFSHETTERLEATREHEVFIRLKILNRSAGHIEPGGGRFAGRNRLPNQKPQFESLLLSNITLVDASNQRVDFKDLPFSKRSPLFTEENYAPPLARINKDYTFTNKLDESSELSLKLRIIEKRKKVNSSSQQHYIKEFEVSLYQAVQAAYTSLLLEVYILPAELFLRPKTRGADKPKIPPASAIIDVNETELEGGGTTPRPLSSSVGKTSILGLSKITSKSRRSSNESLDSLTDSNREKLRKKVTTQLSKDESFNLHPNLREPCLEACKVGANMKTKIVEHFTMQLPSVFVSNQVINRIIDGLKLNFKVRLFSQDGDYRLLPPGCHTEEDLENRPIMLVARKECVWNHSRVKLEGPDTKLDEKQMIDTILSLECGSIEKVHVPRQMHIIITLNCKKLNFWFYNVHKQVQTCFVSSISSLTSWLNARGTLLTRMLLYKARHEIPPHLNTPELLPQTEGELETFLEQGEPPLPAPDTTQQQNTFKNKEIERMYEDLYETYQPGNVRLNYSEPGSRDPLKRHACQLGVYLHAHAVEQKKEDADRDVDVEDLPASITYQQAKLLKKNARLLHYIASPLLFSSKMKYYNSDKETFSYLSNTASAEGSDEPAWFHYFKNQLYDKFIAYLTDPSGYINMSLKYEPRGPIKDVDVNNTLNHDDNEALLIKLTQYGGRILLGVLIQNSTFCVKLYGFDSDNPLKLFQECANLKTQTHTNSFNYDWMVQAIYDSLIKGRDKVPGHEGEILPVHHCVQSVVKHYDTVAEPPHTTCWIKRYGDLEYKVGEYPVSAENLHEYIVHNQESMGVFTIDRDPSVGGSNKKESDTSQLLVLLPINKIANYKFAVIISQLSFRNQREFLVTYYIILASQFHPPFPPKETAICLRSRNESMTTLSSASSPSSSYADEMTVRPRINSQIYKDMEAKRKQDLYRDAKYYAEEEVKRLLFCAQRNFHRDTLIVKLLRPSGKAAISLELSYHSLREEFTYENLCELEGELSFNKNLLEYRSPIFKLLQNWSYSRYKHMLDFLKNKLDLVQITDSKQKEEKSVIGIATRRTSVPGKKDHKVSVVVIKHTDKYLDIFAILKNQDEVHDQDHIEFWERVLSLICVFIWNRLLP